MSLTMAEWRRLKKLSQKEVAEKCGLSVMTIRSWEEHPELIRMGYVPIIAEALGVKSEDIIFYRLRIIRLE